MTGTDAVGFYCQTHAMCVLVICVVIPLDCLICSQAILTVPSDRQELLIRVWLACLLLLLAAYLCHYMSPLLTRLLLHS